MITASGTTTVVGRIDRANDRGVKLAGETEWRNISKFADGCPDSQAFDGGSVSLTLDGQGYIREISPAHAESPTSPPAVRAEPVTNEVQATTEPLSRDVMIARHVALKAAVELLSADITTGADPDITTSLAATFEEWLTRK